MFTIKYRYFQRGETQALNGPTYYDECESLHGPFDVISQSRDNGYLVVAGNQNSGAPGMTFGPFMPGGDAAGDVYPRPTIWIMNGHGATVARYDL